MTTGQENRLSMYLSVDTFLLSNLDILKVLPNFEISYNAFHGALIEIQNLSKLQSYNRSGLTISKKELKRSLALVAGDTNRKLYAYALFVNDKLLMSETSLPQSKLEISSDSKMLDRGKGIYDLAANLGTSVIPYGITEATQLELKKTIDDFSVSMPKRRLSATGSSRITKQIAGCFMSADLSLLQIEALLEIIRSTEANIYEAYRRARKVIEYGTRTIALKGIVIDAETNDPIKGVTINLRLIDATEPHPVIVKKSAAKGGFNLKSVTDGNYEITLMKVGYKELILNNAISKGECCKIKAKMSRAR